MCKIHTGFKDLVQKELCKTAHEYFYIDDMINYFSYIWLNSLC